MPAMLGAGGVMALQPSIVFLVLVIFVVMGFGLMIPNVLSVALKDYSHIAGTAGVWLGLHADLMIGFGLWLASVSQNYGLTLGVCGCGCGICPE